MCGNAVFIIYPAKKCQIKGTYDYSDYQECGSLAAAKVILPVNFYDTPRRFYQEITALQNDLAKCVHFCNSVTLLVDLAVCYAYADLLTVAN